VQIFRCPHATAQKTRVVFRQGDWGVCNTLLQQAPGHLAVDEQRSPWFGYLPVQEINASSHMQRDS